MRELFGIIVLFSALHTIFGQSQKIETEHFKAKYEVEVEKYALASLMVLETAWSIADNNGFNLPEKLKFSIVHSERNALYINRKNLREIIWEYKSPTDFLPPEESKKNNIYGLCHEMGHLSMHNTNHNRNNWMSYDYRESWADYFGNYIIDSIYHQLGTDFWPEPHEFRQYSGMEYFINRIERNNPKLLSFNSACQYWHQLSMAIGFNNFNSLFEAIKIQKVNNPGAKSKYEGVLRGFIEDRDVEEWFSQYAEYLIINEE